MVTINFHMHGGYYGDGNSHYWYEDRYLDLKEGTLTIEREDSYGGQLAGNHQFAHKEVVRDPEVRPAKPLTDEQQELIWNVLEPLITTARKHPHLETYRYFSRRHRYLIQGRVRKATEIAGDSDYHGVDNCVRVWVLLKYNALIRVYAQEQTFWKCKVLPLNGADP